MIVFVLVAGYCLPAEAQHEGDRVYIWPEDSLVKGRLSWWQDQKFGLLMHWGPYSQWGIVESWSLCPEDEDWCQRRGPYAGDYTEYKAAYEKLPATFNPVKFNPEKWARAAAGAGMKYMIFTTKHHDGFCMFDTRQTDYRITAPGCAFATHPRVDVTAEIFNAFRKEGFGIGAYFSKPDWHCPDYWDPYWPPLDRNVNYDPQRYPDKWNRYKAFTHAQIRELLTHYGKVDILWLDGGWVRKRIELREGDGRRLINQDIDMDAMAAEARRLQPGILVVDRAVEGPNQNYLTPEQKVPEKPLAFPWETCMTMANSWSYVPGDTYKSSHELIHLLCRIVSRGGNFLLNIAPGPEGEWDETAYQRLSDIGLWMKQYDVCIYGTRPVAPYEEGNLVYTARDGVLYGIYLVDQKTGVIPEEVELRTAVSGKPRIDIPGQKGKLRYVVNESSAGSSVIRVSLPSSVRDQLKGQAAFVLRLTY